MLHLLFLEQHMVNKITLIIGVLLICFINNQTLAIEQDTTDNQQAVFNSEDDFTELNPQELIVSPLVSENDAHGQLHLSPYDPEHQLYPVQILAIDDWLLPIEDYGKPIFLAAGEHRLRLIPDFSNINPQKIFMDSFWPEKHIAFTLIKGQNLAVAARLKEHNKLEWNVEIYLVQLPVVEE